MSIVFFTLLVAFAFFSVLLYRFILIKMKFNELEDNLIPSTDHNCTQSQSLILF